jgi:two-component system sensor histidine kinase AtoS
LLDYARPRRPELAPVDLNEAARYTSDLVTDDIRHKKLSLREDMSPDKPNIMADRDMVIQAMLNVVLNAVEASPEGGRVAISTAVRGGEPLFAVEDTGGGIRPEERSRILDPFYTTKEKGVGLGLALSASIMEAHHGRIILGGEPGMGARVELVFPAPDQASGEET